MAHTRVPTHTHPSTRTLFALLPRSSHLILLNLSTMSNSVGDAAHFEDFIAKFLDEEDVDVHNLHGE